MHPDDSPAPRPIDPRDLTAVKEVWVKLADLVLALPVYSGGNLIAFGAHLEENSKRPGLPGEIFSGMPEDMQDRLRSAAQRDVLSSKKQAALLKALKAVASRAILSDGDKQAIAQAPAMVGAMIHANKTMLQGLADALSKEEVSPPLDVGFDSLKRLLKITDQNIDDTMRDTVDEKAKTAGRDNGMLEAIQAALIDLNNAINPKRVGRA